jgi:hypothetical protein
MPRDRLSPGMHHQSSIRQRHPGFRALHGFQAGEIDRKWARKLVINFVRFPKKRVSGDSGRLTFVIMITINRLMR